jgi:hypothetical protein
METYYTDNQAYTADEAVLREIEPALSSGVAAGSNLVVTQVTDQDYTIEVTQPKTDSEFTIAKSVEGVVTRTCEAEGEKGCPEGGSW